MKGRTSKWQFIVFAIVGPPCAVFLLAACAPVVVEQVFEPSASHANYMEALQVLEIDETDLGSSWIEQARLAIERPIVVVTPIEEVVFIDPTRPTALGYEFAVRRGRRVTIEIETELDRYFADVLLTNKREGDSPEIVASKNSDEGIIEFEPRRDSSFILRIQPELLRGGRMRIRIIANASLAFPVESAGPGDIISYFADPRDGGERDHHGLDIIAPRGTPLLAASDSLVSRVGQRVRGGNTVTLYDSERDLVLYYAHLEEQLAIQGSTVAPGDVVGTTGNTGNAAGGPTHLHIGLYQGSWRYPVDPWDYFVPPPVTQPEPAQFESWIGRWYRTNDQVTLVEELAGPQALLLYQNRNRQLPRALDTAVTDESLRSATRSPSVLAGGSAVEVVGAAGALVRVRTPSGETGFADASFLQDRFTALDLVDVGVYRDVRSGDVFAEAPAGTRLIEIGQDRERSVVRVDGSMRIALLE